MRHDFEKRRNADKNPIVFVNDQLEKKETLPIEGTEPDNIYLLNASPTSLP